MSWARETYSEQQLAAMALIDEGVNQAEAWQYIATSGTDVADLAAIKAEHLDAEVEAAYEATPEGRLEAGRLAREAEEQRAEATANARALLRAEGVDDSDLTDEEARHASGVEVKGWDQLATPAEVDRAAEDLAIAFDTLSDADKATGLSLLGVSRAAIRGHREALGLTVDGIGLDPPPAWSMADAGANVEGGEGDAA